MKNIIIELKIPEYKFGDNDNSYAFDVDDREDVGLISQKIEQAIIQNFSDKDVLVRGIQSGLHDGSRDELINYILQNGCDYKCQGLNSFHATQLTKGTVDEILEAFHVYKPKCRDRPQKIVDIWMVFDKNAFENIEYLHPRHKVTANDKWQQKDNLNNGLIGILVIN